MEKTIKSVDQHTITKYAKKCIVRRNVLTWAEYIATLNATRIFLLSLSSASAVPGTLTYVT